LIGSSRFASTLAFHSIISVGLFENFQEKLALALEMLVNNRPVMPASAIFAVVAP
jgi:hypothetical protein